MASFHNCMDIKPSNDGTKHLRHIEQVISIEALAPELLAEATRNQTPWYGYGFMAREQEGVRMPTPWRS